jgi:hypothetical protein
MKTQHILALTAVAVLVSACGKSKEPSVTVGLPAECEAYAQQMNTCVEKISGANKATADIIKKQLDDAKTGWKTAASAADKEKLGQACKAAQDAFQANAKMMGC